MSDILPFNQWLQNNAAETDPVNQLKKFAGYVRNEHWKRGTYDSDVERGIENGIESQARELGLFSDDTSEEDRVALRDKFSAPDRSIDSEADFVYDDIRFNPVSEEHPLAAEDRDIISRYVASRNLAKETDDVEAKAQAESFLPEVDRILGNRDVVNRAKRNALTRGDVSAVALEDKDGNRFVAVGPDPDEAVVRSQTDSLINRGAIAPEDIPSLSMSFKQSAFGATNAEITRQSEFMGDLQAIAKNDKDLQELLNKDVQSTTLRKKEEIATTGESILNTGLDIIGGTVSAIGGAVMDNFKALKEEGLSALSPTDVVERTVGAAQDVIKSESELRRDYRDMLLTTLKNNTALADKYSEAEIDKLTDDYVKLASGPAYRPDKIGSAVDTTSTGIPIVAPEIALRPEAFEEHLAASSLSDTQKESAREMREKLAEQTAPETIKFLSRMDEEFVDALATSRSEGKKDIDFVQQWLGDEKNYDNFQNRAKSFGLETIKAIASIPTTAMALMGNEQAAKSLVGMNKDAGYGRYAELFGDRFGVAQQLGNLVPSVGVDLLLAAGTGGLATAAKQGVSTVARGVARNVAVKAVNKGATNVAVKAFGSAIGKIDNVASALTTAIQSSNATSKAFTTIANGLRKGAVGAGRFTENLAAVGPSSFLRSAGGTYASVYGELPDTMTHEAKHEASVGYAVTAGLFTATITAGLSALGLGGTEKLATRNLDDLTFSQVRKLYSNTLRASRNVLDKDIKRAIKMQTSGAFKSLVREHVEGFVSEGFEEGLDQAFQIMVDQAAKNQDVPIREIGKGVFDAVILGGLMGAGTTALRQVMPTLTEEGKQSEQEKMLRARDELYTSIASKLTGAGAPKTAEALAQVFAQADADAVAASTPPTTDPTEEVQLDPMNLPTDTLFERWNPSDETTGVLADYDGTLVRYAGNIGLVKTDNDGNVFFEYRERQEKPIDESTGSKKRKKKVTDKKKVDKKASVVRLSLGNGAQLAKGIIERPYTAMRVTQDLPDIKAGSLAVKVGKVWYALPHIDDVTEPPRVVRNNKGEPVGLGFQQVKMVGGNATRDFLMVSFDGPVYDVAKYYDINFSQLERMTAADNTGAQVRQSKEEREKIKAEAKANRAVLVTEEPEQELSPLDQLVLEFRGLDVLTDPDVELEDLAAPELGDLANAIDDVVNTQGVDPEVVKQLITIQTEVKTLHAEKEEFVAMERAEFQDMNSERGKMILDNLPSDFSIKSFRQIKVKIDGEEVIAKPIGINRNNYKVRVKLPNNKIVNVDIANVDATVFDEVMPVVEVRETVRRYSKSGLKKLDEEDLVQIEELAGELLLSNPNNTSLFSWVDKLRTRITDVRNEREAKAAKLAEKEAKEPKAAKTSKAAKAAKATEPAAEAEVEADIETNPVPDKPAKERKSRARVKEEIFAEAGRDIANGTNPDEDNDEDQDTEIVPEVVSDESPLTDEEFDELKKLQVPPAFRPVIDDAIARNPEYREAIIAWSISAAKKSPKKGGMSPLNLVSLRDAVSKITADEKNKTTVMVQRKVNPDPSVEEGSKDASSPDAVSKPTTATVTIGKGTAYKMPDTMVTQLGTSKNTLHPLKKNDRDSVDMALSYAASLDKKSVVTLTSKTASELPDVTGVSNKAISEANTTSPIVLIKKGRKLVPHPALGNIAAIAAAKQLGVDVKVLVVSKLQTNFNGEVTIVNELEINKRKVEAGRVLQEAINDVTSSLDQKVFDGNNRSLTLAEFIRRMQTATDRNKARYIQDHRDAFQTAIEEVNSSIAKAVKLMSGLGAAPSEGIVSMMNTMAEATNILNREIKVAAPKSDVVSNVDYRTPDLLPVFRSEQEKSNFEELVEAGYPVGDLGPYIGRTATGLTGVKHEAEPLKYLSGKRTYLLKRIRERYPVLEWEAANEAAIRKGKDEPYHVYSKAKSLKYTPDPEKPSTWVNVPVIVDKNGDAVFTNDPKITAAQLSVLGVVTVPENFEADVNKSIKTITDSLGNRIVVSVEDVNGLFIMDEAKGKTTMNLETLTRARNIANAMGGLSSVTGAVLNNVALPDSSAPVRNAADYLQKVEAYLVNKITKGNPDRLSEENSQVVTEALTAVIVDLIEFSTSFKLATYAVNSKRFSEKMAKKLKDQSVEEVPLQFFNELKDMTEADLKQTLSINQIMGLFPMVESKADLAALLEARHPELVTNKNAQLKGESRQDNIILNYGTMMALRMSDIAYATGPSPAKVFNNIYTRYRQTYAKSQTGVTNVSYEVLMTTPAGGWSVSEASPSAGVLDDLQSELEMIDDTSSSDVYESLRQMFVETVDNSVELKESLITLGNKFTRNTGLFTHFSANNSAEEISTAVANVINAPIYQGSVRQALTDLPSTPDGRRMLALFSMMGWAPNPDSGFRIPTVEEIMATRPNNLDPEAAQEVRNEIQAEIDEMTRQKALMIEGSRAYDEALTEALQSDEGQEVREMFLKQYSIDQKINELKEARNLLMMVRRTDNPMTREWQDEKAKQAEEMLNSKRDAINARRSEIDRNIKRLEGITSGFDSGVIDPIPLLNEALTELGDIDARIDALPVAPSLTQKEYTKLQTLRSKFAVEMNLERQAKREADKSGKPKDDTVKKLKEARSANSKRDRDDLARLNKKLNDNVAYTAERKQLDDLRAQAASKVTTYKRLSSDPDVMQGVNRVKQIDAQIKSLKKDKRIESRKVLKQLPKSVWSRVKKSPEVIFYERKLEAIARQETLVKKAQEAMVTATTRNRSARLETLNKARTKLDSLKATLGQEPEGFGRLRELKSDVLESNQAKEKVKSIEDRIAALQFEKRAVANTSSQKVRSAQKMIDTLKTERESLNRRYRNLRALNEVVDLFRSRNNPSTQEVISNRLTEIEDALYLLAGRRDNVQSEIVSAIVDGTLDPKTREATPEQIEQEAREAEETARKEKELGITQIRQRLPQLEEKVATLGRDVALASQELQSIQREINTTMDALEGERNSRKRAPLEKKRDSLTAEFKDATERYNQLHDKFMESSRLLGRARQVVGNRALYSPSNVDMLNAAINRAANKAEIRNLGLMESPIVALQNIAKSGPPHLRLIAKLILRNQDALDGLRVFVEEFDPRNAGFQKGNIIAINLSGHNGKGVADVLIHEMVHYITRQALLDPDVAARMDKLRELARTRLLAMNENLADFDYALDSNEEFLSAVFTDPRLQEALDVTANGAPRSLFQKILDFILRVFNADNAQTQTAMRELVRFTQESANSMIYGSRADVNRQAQTVRYDKQYASRIRNFLDEMSNMTFDTALADFQDRLGFGETALASPSRSSSRFDDAQKRKWNTARQNAVEARLRLEMRYEDIDGQNEADDNVDSLMGAIDKMTQQTDSEDIWEAMVSEIGREIGFDFYEEYSDIDRRTNDRARNDPRFATTVAKEMSGALEVLKDAKDSKAKGRKHWAAGLTRQEIAERRAAGKLRIMDPLSQLELLLLNARDFFVAGPTPLYKYDGFLATEHDMYPSRPITEDFKKAYVNMVNYFSPVLESGNQGLIDTVTNLIDAWADIYGNRRYNGPPKSKRGRPLASPSVTAARDTRYLAAVEAGDMRAAQEMVDEAAKAAGFSDSTFYHGTTSDEFEIFDRSLSDKKYSGAHALGKGFYFTEDRSIADSYGSNGRVITAKLRLNNTLQLQGVSKQRAVQIVEEFNAAVGRAFNREGDTLRWSTTKRNVFSPRIVDNGDGTFNVLLAVNNVRFRNAFGEDLDTVFQRMGYDSASNGWEVAVFNPSQIKSADPVTYDANGNVIPLSQRFNPQSNSILFSPSVTRDTDLESRIRSKVPAGMTLVADTELRGVMAVTSSGVISYNPELLAESIDGYDPEIADQMINVMVTHEIGHEAANRVMTPQDYDDIAAELGREELDKAASLYYSLAYPNLTDREAAMAADRESGDLDDRRIAAEWVRMQIDKAILGKSSEELLSRFVKKPSVIARIVEAIRAFIGAARKRQDTNFSLKIAADISRATREAALLLNGGVMPASPEPQADVEHAAELLGAAVNGSHQILYTMPLHHADKKNQATNTVWDRVKKLATRLPSTVDKLVKDREGRINEARLIVERFAAQYRFYLEKAIKDGADINDVSLILGSTSPLLDEEAEQKVAEKVIAYRASLDSNDPDLIDKVNRYKYAVTQSELKGRDTKFLENQRAAEARLSAISPEFVKSLKTFRDEIDKRQMAVRVSPLTGIYLTRTYQFFRTEGWAAAARQGGSYRLNGEVIDFDALREKAAQVYESQIRADFAKRGETLTADRLRDEMFTKLDGLLARLEEEAKSDTGDSIRQDLARSMPKGVINPALRELLGEVTNPFENAVRTFGYVSMLDSNAIALKSIRETLIASGLAFETQRAGYEQVFGKGKSETMAPLAGLYVREDIAKELTAEFSGSAARLLNHTDKVMQSVGRSLSRVSGAAMTAKTLMSVGFYTRNWVTNQIVLPAAQGILPADPRSRVFYSYRLARLANFQSSGKETDREVIADLEKLTRLSVLRDSPQRGNFDDIVRGFADRTGATYESVLDDIVRAAQDSDYASMSGIIDKLKSVAGKGVDILASLNGLMDDAAKAQVFFFERSELKAAYPEWTEEQLDEEAARKVKMTMPGHSQQLDIIRSFNRNPLALMLFPFARWKTEVLRTLVNTYKLGLSEIRSGNPRMVWRGVRRVGCNPIVVVGGPALAGSVLTSLFAALIDDEEEDKKQKSKVVDDPRMISALRMALPEWQRGHYLSMSTNGRELRVVDMTAMMPYSAVSDSINLIMEGMRSGKGLDAKGVAAYWKSQFIGSQIASSALLQVSTNRDDFGNNIYEETDSITASSMKILGHIYKKAYEPGVVAKGRAVTREGELERDQIFWGEILGARPVAYKLDRVASSGFYNLKEQFDSAKRLRTKLSSGRFISDEDFVDVMTEAQNYEDRIQAQTHRFITAMRFLGYDDRFTALSAKQTGMSRKRFGEALYGINTSWIGNKDWVTNMVLNVEKGGEDDPRRRVELLRSTYESLPPTVNITNQ